MHKLFIRTTFTALVCGSLAAPAFAQQVSLTLKDGLVTIKAENATVRQILDEWARVGQAKIVNADKLAGQPVTLTLVDKPEREALDIILRGTTGYIAIDRATPVANASSYERLLVMSKTTTALASTSGSSGSAAAYTPPVYNPIQGDPAQGDDPIPPNGGEPPEPTAPVVSPYSQAPGMMNQGNTGATGASINGAANGAAGPDVKFDYANPVPYFERQRQLQQQQQQQLNQPTATPGGQIGNPNGPALLPQPGMAPTPPPQQQNPYNPYTNPTGAGAGNSSSGSGGFNPYNPPPNFNPYNLKPGEPIPGTTPQQGAQPDRAKYANPYQPQPTPPQQ